MIGKNSHPIIIFSYFVIVIVASMVFMDPILLAISFFSSFILSVRLKGKKAAKFNLLFALPLALIIAIVNPLINTRGTTLLFYLFDHPVTMEAALYGFTSGLMVSSIIIWFSSYNALVSSDKFIYIFGKIIPSLSLIFSMVMSFVPRLKQEAITIMNSQKCIGLSVDGGKLKDRIRSGIRVLSILVTWALENSVDTADSMRSRGYGLPNRTSFSLYTFSFRDSLEGLVLIFLFAVFLYSALSGSIGVEYFPQLAYENVRPYGYIAFALICLLPSLGERDRSDLEGVAI